MAACISRHLTIDGVQLEGNHVTEGIPIINDVSASRLRNNGMSGMTSEARGAMPVSQPFPPKAAGCMTCADHFHSRTRQLYHRRHWQHVNPIRGYGSLTPHRSLSSTVRCRSLGAVFVTRSTPIRRRGLHAPCMQSNGAASNPTGHAGSMHACLNDRDRGIVSVGMEYSYPYQYNSPRGIFSDSPVLQLPSCTVVHQSDVESPSLPPRERTNGAT
ncbi:hypothetical protein BDV95DRAFT_664615 [Massariosphaeria phaeospora]|uniref:Uncharacterized protein n=1 Tax=Massariosphaeria phaeospora TaxID=100035 RepID=A0A7C8MEI8_9PLEO|nr:hypothetical protein BDV95DRAFT_664615 [Massariosphaeria phaeospora]